MLLIQWCQIQVDGKVIRHRTVGIAILGQDMSRHSSQLYHRTFILAYHYIYCKNSWSIYHIQVVRRVWHTISHVNLKLCISPNIIWTRRWEKQGSSQVIVFLAIFPSCCLQKNPRLPALSNIFGSAPVMKVDSLTGIRMLNRNEKCTLKTEQPQTTQGYTMRKKARNSFCIWRFLSHVRNATKNMSLRWFWMILDSKNLYI